MGKSNAKSSLAKQNQQHGFIVKTATSASSKVKAKHSLKAQKKNGGTIVVPRSTTSTTTTSGAATDTTNIVNSCSSNQPPSISTQHERMGYAILTHLQTISGTAYSKTIKALKEDLLVLYGSSQNLLV